MLSTKSKTKLKFKAIGTVWEIEVFHGVVSAELQKKIARRVEGFDQTYSRFRNDSWVSQLAKKPGRYQLPTDAPPLLRLYDELYGLTDGQMTPLIGQQLVEAGYDMQYSLKPTPLTNLPAWGEVATLTGKHLITHQKIQLDVGAAGKGYLVDIIGKLLQSAGLDSFVIDASGDLLIRNASPLQQIGLENPDDTTEVIGVVELSNSALCASAGNRRKWANFTHVINPKTKSSPDHIRAIWVVADTALLADGLSTALYFASAELLQKQYTFEYAILAANNELSASAKFPGQFFGDKH